jgi:Tfp pilus assembly protein PilW
MRFREPRASMRAEDGFTLVEVLLGAVLSLLVIYAGLAVLDNSVKLARVTDQRVDASQRGREAMETVTRELRSQVCLGSQPALTAGSDTAVTYYVNLVGHDATPERHSMALVNGDLVLNRYVGTGTTPNLTFPAQPTSSRVVAENVQQVGTTPIFRYYKWNSSGATVVPTTQLATPLTTATLGEPVKIAISFRVNPGRSFGSTNGYSDLHDSVYTRTSDPNDVSRGPLCS